MRLALTSPWRAGLMLMLTIGVAWCSLAAAPAHGKALVTITELMKVGETIPTPCDGTGYLSPGHKVTPGADPHDYPYFYQATHIGGDVDSLYALNEAPGDGFPSGCINESGMRGPFKVTAPGTYKQTIQNSYGFVHCENAECHGMDLNKTGSNAAGSHNTFESFTVTYQAFVLNPIYSDVDRRKFSQDANVDNTLAGLLGLLGPSGCEAVPDPRAKIACATAVGTMAGSFLVDGFLKTWRANDPIDRHYRTLSKPVSVNLPVVTDGLPPDMVNAERKLFPTLGVALGLDRAINTALNRAQGAYLAHNAAWKRAQIVRAQQLSARAAIVEQPLASRIKAFLTSLGSLQSSAPPLTSDDVQVFSENVLSSGPSSFVDTALRTVRATAEERTMGLIGLISQAIPTGNTFTTVGNDPRIVPGIQAGLAATAHFARSGPTKRWRTSP